MRWECVLWCNSRLEKTIRPIVSLLLFPCERSHSLAQTYHSSPLPVAPGLEAAGAYRPAALLHLIPLHTPEDHSPTFVIGKYAEEPVCAPHDKEGEGPRGETQKTQISAYFPDWGSLYETRHSCSEERWNDVYDTTLHRVIINPLTTTMSHTPQGIPAGAFWKHVLNTHAQWECWWMACLMLWEGDREREGKGGGGGGAARCGRAGERYWWNYRIDWLISVDACCNGGMQLKLMHLD